MYNYVSSPAPSRCSIVKGLPQLHLSADKAELLLFSPRWRWIYHLLLNTILYYTLCILAVQLPGLWFTAATIIWRKKNVISKLNNYRHALRVLQTHETSCYYIALSARVVPFSMQKQLSPPLLVAVLLGIVCQRHWGKI